MAKKSTASALSEIKSSLSDKVSPELKSQHKRETASLMRAELELADFALQIANDRLKVQDRILNGLTDAIRRRSEEHSEAGLVDFVETFSKYKSLIDIKLRGTLVTLHEALPRLGIPPDKAYTMFLDLEVELLKLFVKNPHQYEPSKSRNERR